MDLNDEKIRGKNAMEMAPKSQQSDKRITRNINELKGTVNDLEGQLAQVREAQGNLEQRRKDRNQFLKTGNRIQVFAANFHDFLDAYSAIHGIARAADAQYGGLATETLSLLLIVAVSKQGREVAISDALRDLTPWLSRLQKYREAYQESDEMQNLVGEVHKKIADFSEESCRYFNRKPFARFWEAIKRPANLAVDAKVSEIKDAIFQVVSEGLAQFISNYEANARQGIADKWTVIQKLIGLPIDQLNEKMLSKACEDLYADAFEYPGTRRGKALQQADIDMLKREVSFCQWNEESGPSTLLLTGHNFDQFGKGVGLCWLSSAALAIKQNIGNGDRVLFYSACRDEDSRRTPAREPFSNILSSFICQCLQWDERFFEKSFKQVEQELKDPVWRSKSVEDRHHIQRDLLISLLNSWTGSRAIYMIVDRLDKIDSDPDENLYDLIREILLIVSKTTCAIKLVITADSLHWESGDKEIKSRWKDWRGDPDLAWDKVASIHSHVRWHQPEIGRS